MNLHRKDRSRVPLPPRHEHKTNGHGRSAPLLPGRSAESGSTIEIPCNPELDLDPPRPREPSVSNFDRLWASITGLALGWFTHPDHGHLILWYDLNEKFSQLRPPKDQKLSVRIEGSEGKVTIATDPALVWADGHTLYVRADYSEKAVRWLETDRESTSVILVRPPLPAEKGKTKVKGRRLRREIALVPVRAGHVPRFY